MAVTSVLIDTNAYAAYKRGEETVVEIFRHVTRIGISVIVLGELLAGFAAGNRERRNREELQAFLDTPRIDILANDPTTADYSAQVYIGLRKRGRPIPTNDLWIAATALQHGMVLFSLDRHFAETDGLLVVDSVAALVPSLRARSLTKTPSARALRASAASAPLHHTLDRIRVQPSLPAAQASLLRA